MGWGPDREPELKRTVKQLMGDYEKVAAKSPADQERALREIATSLYLGRSRAVVGRMISTGYVHMISMRKDSYYSRSQGVMDRGFFPLIDRRTALTSYSVIGPEDLSGSQAVSALEAVPAQQLQKLLRLSAELRSKAIETADKPPGLGEEIEGYGQISDATEKGEAHKAFKNKVRALLPEAEEFAIVGVAEGDETALGRPGQAERLESRLKNLREGQAAYMKEGDEWKNWEMMESQ